MELEVLDFFGMEIALAVLFTTTLIYALNKNKQRKSEYEKILSIMVKNKAKC